MTRPLCPARWHLTASIDACPLKFLFCWSLIGRRDLLGNDTSVELLTDERLQILRSAFVSGIPLLSAHESPLADLNSKFNSVQLRFVHAAAFPQSTFCLERFRKSQVWELRVSWLDHLLDLTQRREVRIAGQFAGAV